MTRWISCKTGAMKSPRRSTDSLAAGARNGVATYDRLEAESVNGSVYCVAGGAGVGEVAHDPVALAATGLVDAGGGWLGELSRAAGRQVSPGPL